MPTLKPSQMAKTEIPPLFAQLLKTFTQIVVRLPQKPYPEHTSSLKLRNIAFDLYTELMFLMRVHHVDYHDHDLALTRLFEGIIWNIHTLYHTQQVGTPFSAPH